MHRHYKDISKLLVFIFIVNFIWEISQMFLYQNHVTNFLNFILVHLKASLGDVIIFLIIYGIGILITQNKKWILSNNIFKYLLASFLGLIISANIEKYALATERWSYKEIMPIIPFFQVGLLPVLQMILLPILTIYLLEKFQNKNSSI